MPVQSELSTGEVVLRSAASSLRLNPGLGGAVCEFLWRDIHVLRPAAKGSASDPFAYACFPLVPYANRIAQGRFAFGGRSVRLEPNWEGSPHPLHGQGWRRPWRVVEATQTMARLALEGGGDGWPWVYSAQQTYELSADALKLTLELQNLADLAIPAILGIHPYFPNAAKARLQAELPLVWMTNDEILPIEKVPTPGPWSFSKERAVNTVILDHCFEGWNGLAEMRWPNHRLKISATHCNCLHVYAPLDGGFFCVEPQTAAAGAIERGEYESIALQPGATVTMSVRFEVGAT